jgi:hypothetical protein
MVLHRKLWLLCLVLVAIGFVAGVPRAAAQQASMAITQGAALPLDPEFMGMAVRDPWYEFNTNPALPNQTNTAFLDTMGEVLARAGVRWVRFEFQVPGPLTLPREAVEFEISKNDYFINTVAPRHGFKVLAVLSFGLAPWNDPCDLNLAGATHPRFGGGVNAYMEAWLTRALLIADRYGDKIAAYEVLNEQNRLGDCKTPAKVTVNSAPQQVIAIDPKVVGRLITKLYRFCRGIMPLPPDEPAHGCVNAQIVLGGLHPRGSSLPNKEATTMTDQQYLAAIYGDPDSFAGFRSANGRYPVDGVGYHPYTEEIRLSPNNALVDRGIARIRRTLQEAGDPCIPLWITEVGYNVGFDIDGPKGPTPVQTEAGQAAFIFDVFTTLAARRLPNSPCSGAREVANVFWFKYEDFPPPEDVFDNWGRLITPAQRWGVVRIPFDGSGRYAVDGRPVLYRQSYGVYRVMAGMLQKRSYLPAVGR